MFHTFIRRRLQCTSMSQSSGKGKSGVQTKLPVQVKEKDKRLSIPDTRKPEAEESGGVPVQETELKKELSSIKSELKQTVKKSDLDSAIEKVIKQQDIEEIVKRVVKSLLKETKESVKKRSQRGT